MQTLDKLKSGLATGRLNRRDFMTGALALGLSIPAATSIVGSVQAMTPKKGGKFRQAITGGGSGDVLDPAQTLDSYMIQISFGQLRNNLTEIAPDGSLMGELAESWDASIFGE